MQVTIESSTCIPHEYSHFSPMYDLSHPVHVRIDGHTFNSVCHFLLYSKFNGKDSDYAALFTEERAQDLQELFERVHTNLLGRLLTNDPSGALQYMGQADFYFAAKGCLKSPKGLAWFVELESDMNQRASALMATWVQHRYGGVEVPVGTKFESKNFTEFAKSLNNYFSQRHMEPARSRVLQGTGLSFFIKAFDKPNEMTLCDAVLGPKRDMELAKKLVIPHCEEEIFCQLIELLKT